MENSYYNSANSFPPFGHFQGTAGDASRSSALVHHGAFSIPPTRSGQLTEPRLPAGPGLSCDQGYNTPGRISLPPSAFRQASLASQQRMPQFPPSVVAQFQPPPPPPAISAAAAAGEFPRSSVNVNLNMPPPPPPPPPVNMNVCPSPRVNVNIPPAPPVNMNNPPPLPANINVPPPPSIDVNVPLRPPPIDRNMPPPGYHPQVPPPSHCPSYLLVFRPHFPPPPLPVIAAATSSSAPFTRSRVPHFVSGAEQRLGIRRPPAQSFTTSQRLPSQSTNEQDIAGNSVMRQTLVQPSSRDTFFSDVRCSHLMFVQSSFPARICESSGSLTSQRASVDVTSASDVTTAVSAESAVLHRRRRKASTTSNITFAKFRQLLKDAMFLNDRLRKYVESHSCPCAERSVGHSDNRTLSEPTDLHQTVDASDTVSDCVIKSHQTIDSTDSTSERHTVRIVSASVQNDQHCSLSSFTAPSQSAAESSSVISKQELAKMQERLEELRRQISSFLGAVIARQKRTTSKRKRVKRRRQSVYKQSCELARKRERRHEEIDKYMNEISQKQRAAKMELEMKEAADLTLAEVQRKISETNNCMKLIGRLRKLRQLRKDQAERKGVVIRRSADEMFEQRVQALTATLREQMELYDAEQRTLQVMLETEHEQTKEKEREQEQVRIKQRLASYEDQLRTWLFSDQSSVVDSLDPMFPYVQYYDLANSSIDTFVKIRQEWDLHAVPAGSGVSGSRIPAGWVIPTEPTDEVWASALKQQ